jgi:DNA-binding CsgD family transcriptional regulator
MKKKPITPREKDVCDLIVLGLTNQEIADRLNLQEKSIKSYLTQIYIKEGVKNRLELVVKLLGRSK